ncbi:MAG: TetR/AcrR family transcriptional regulator [Lachnospiraceae bacterium]|nr:TetR/AcrR family transcriptional regulator [Ruminococcus sp.]MCM1276304.1 TetR/AcrR family transcriptional regulator [Lachnospiraceae bacterium]
MAVKNHSLDDGIINAAAEEFMKHGFAAASLHKIAERANVTTGALYTRYKSKDALFLSLLEDVFAVFKERSEYVERKYRQAEQSGSAEDFLAAMEFETRIYTQLFSERYEACMLLFCKSGGSSAEKLLEEMIAQKVETTAEFFERNAKHPIDTEAVRLLMDAHFHIFRKAMERSGSSAEAVAGINNVQPFFSAGWLELFKQAHI